MNTLNIAQPLPRVVVRLPIVRQDPIRRPATANRPVSLHCYVQSELQRSDRYHAFIFAALMAAGFVTVVLSFLGPYLGGGH